MRLDAESTRVEDTQPLRTVRSLTRKPASGSAEDETEAPNTTPNLPTVGSVGYVELSRIDRSDTTYRFRANLRVAGLARAFEADGQQVPVILRPHPKGTRPYQLVSGFRRCAAAERLGWTRLYAEIRELDEDAAFSLAVAENTNRKSYSDLDRAHVVVSQKAVNMTEGQIGTLLGVSDRRVRHLRKLLDFPAFVRDAVDDAEHRMTLGHALALGRAAEKADGAFPWEEWVQRVADEALSRRALQELLKGEVEKPKKSKEELFAELERVLKEIREAGYEVSV